MSKFLLVIGGPTASGKTGLAIRLAKHFNTAIVSADSRQLFQEMRIGTARPTAEELAQAPHYLIGSHSISEGYSVGQYEADALRALQLIFAHHDYAVLVGGSGLYINAVCQGLDHFPPVSAGVQEALQAVFESEGLAPLQQELQELDPAYYQEVDRSNPHRLIRALSIIRSSGQPFSSFRKKQKSQRPFTPIYLQLQRPREELYSRIDQRVEQMLEEGLEMEARSLFAHRRHTALQTVGYQELFDYFGGRHDLSTAVELVKRNSRRYAKRQMTWFRRDGHWKLIGPDDWDVALQFISLAAEEGLSIHQPFHKEGQVQALAWDKNGQPSNRGRRFVFKGGSTSVIQQLDKGPAGSLLLHQLSLLTIDEKEAHLLLPADAQGASGWDRQHPGCPPPKYDAPLPEPLPWSHWRRA